MEKEVSTSYYATQLALSLYNNFKNKNKYE